MRSSDDPPVSFDPQIYRSLHPDLATFTDDQLAKHYRRHGKAEGRLSHAVADRQSFINLAGSSRALEIGPYDRPLLTGPNVRYADIFSTEQLRDKAKQENLRPEGVPQIDWVVQPTDLSPIDQTFDVVISSHAVEHQPNLVAHLRQVSNLLNPGGRYLLLVPDYRYCFDHFKTPSTIADVLDAYCRGDGRHAPRSLVQSRLLMTHNDSVRHWNGDHGESEINPEFPGVDRIGLLQIALDEIQNKPHALRNEHAWMFHPDNFESIINDLVALELFDLHLERLYPTIYQAIEFWAILRKPGG